MLSAIVRTNGYPDLCYHMTSLDHNGLMINDILYHLQNNVHTFQMYLNDLIVNGISKVI